MKRVGLNVIAAALALAVIACGADSKSSQSTTPVAPEPVADTAPPAPPAEPAKPAEPPAPTYLPGKWVWFELHTSDVEKAKAFYTEVLGWTIAEREMGGQKYNAVSVGGKELALVQALGPDAKKQKLSTAWMGYVSVSDVDAAFAAATGAGAKPLMPATDMPGVGRFAALTDPSGAPFGMVKTTKGDEADAMPTAGQIVWFEHLAKDAKKAAEAAAFYTAVAGYQTSTIKMGKDDYTLAAGAGAPRMGFARAPKASVASRFAAYVMVADTDATVKVATKLKAKVVIKPMDVPNVGRVALLTDPQGGLFGLISIPTAPAAAPPPATPAPTPTTPATPAPTTPAPPAAPTK